MEDHLNRIKHPGLRKYVCSVEEAAERIKDGDLVATSGNTLAGYPKGFFMELAERIRGGERIKIDLLSSGPLGPEIEDALVQVKGIRRRIGSIGSKLLRDAVNKREVGFLEGKTGKVAQYARAGYYGDIDVAVIEAAGISEEGEIIPGISVYDAPDWVELASRVIVEINLLRPQSLDGLHDIYCPGPNRWIPLTHPLERIGKAHIPVDPGKIAGIIFSRIEDRSLPASKPDEKSIFLAKNLGDFLRGEKKRKIYGGELPPIEIGIGETMNVFLSSLVGTDLRSLQFFLAAVTDPLLDLIDAGNAIAVSGNSLRFSREALTKLYSRIDHYRKHLILRPVQVTNSAELISRLGVLAINTCLEADLLGQINSSHVRGSLLIGGIAGSYDYARNSAVSIFALPSRSRGGISNIVPQVSHVDHTEHEVDVLVTEHGVADLRGLEPIEKSLAIMEKCAHPDDRRFLKDRIEITRNNPGRTPLGFTG
jgi:succinyl-CoA:acetate CoA-transferase